MLARRYEMHYCAYLENLSHRLSYQSDNESWEASNER